MERFITIEEYDGTIHAFNEHEKEWKKELSKDKWAEYVWQFAKDKATAIKQHYKKHDEWAEDVNNDRAIKDTY